MHRLLFALPLLVLCLPRVCIGRELTPCQIGDPSIRTTISATEVITIRARIVATMHSGFFLDGDGCDSPSIHLVDVSGGKDVSATIAAIHRAEIYDHSYLALATGRLRRLGTGEEFDTTALSMEAKNP
ncbi:MAG TPA: hypothetical protein VGN07_07895 [Steroidobacteraceae bacterium]